MLCSPLDPPARAVHEHHLRLQQDMDQLTTVQGQLAGILAARDEENDGCECHHGALECLPAVVAPCTHKLWVRATPTCRAPSPAAVLGLPAVTKYCSELEDKLSAVHHLVAQGVEQHALIQQQRDSGGFLGARPFSSATCRDAWAAPHMGCPTQCGHRPCMPSLCAVDSAGNEALRAAEDKLAAAEEEAAALRVQSDKRASQRVSQGRVEGSGAVHRPRKLCL
jgi:hypothetical protein